jgi:DNA-binding CsgD family transcriptional regulator
MFFQIARETILSHINNIHEKIMQSRAYSKSHLEIKKIKKFEK